MWRLLGYFPQAKTAEEIRAQSLDGWSPWKYYPWNRCEEPGIVVPDIGDSKRFRHALTYWIEHDGKVIKFAVDCLERGWRFFVPAASTEEGAFEARIPMYEGHWRSSFQSDEDLPWPRPGAKWSQRAAFLEALDRVESEAERISHRGFSPCRICGCKNGSQSFRLDVWEWPSGFRHYVADHEVRPSAAFDLFVRESTR